VRTLVWSAAFVRAFKRAVRRQPELRINNGYPTAVGSGNGCLPSTIS
jgi:hypothetical protein